MVMLEKLLNIVDMNLNLDHYGTKSKFSATTYVIFILNVLDDQSSCRVCRVAHYSFHFFFFFFFSKLLKYA